VRAVAENKRLPKANPRHNDFNKPVDLGGLTHNAEGFARQRTYSMKQNQKGRRGRNRNQNRRSCGNGSRDRRGQPTRNQNQTKQQVEKYTSLAREALQSQDFVAAQNYFQHADYFQRLLNELAGSQEQRKPAKASRTDEGSRSRQQAPQQDQQSGQVISIEAGDPSDEGAKDGDDEALSA